MAANEHRNLLDANRHNPKGFESAENNTVLSKKSGVTYDDKLGMLSWDYPLQTFILRLDEVTAGAGKDYLRFPYKFRLTAVRASVYTSSGAVLTVDILEEGVSILSTLLTIDAGEKTSTTAATPVVISDYEIADDAEVRIDISAIEEAPEKLRVYLIGYRMN
jgi:hypothetical protein